MSTKIHTKRPKRHDRTLLEVEASEIIADLAGHHSPIEPTRANYGLPYRCVFCSAEGPDLAKAGFPHHAGCVYARASRWCCAMEAT